MMLIKIFLCHQNCRLQEIQDEIDTSKNKTKTTTSTKTASHLLLLVYLEEVDLPEELLLRLPSLVEEQDVEAPKVFLLPGIEGTCTSLKALARELPAHTFCLQYLSDGAKSTLTEMAWNFFKVKKTHLTTPSHDITKNLRSSKNC